MLCKIYIYHCLTHCKCFNMFVPLATVFIHNWYYKIETHNIQLML